MFTNYSIRSPIAPLVASSVLEEKLQIKAWDNNRTPVARAAMALITLVIGVGQARADVILNLTIEQTNQLKNLNSLEEAVAGTLFEMAVPFTFSAGERLEFSGTFTDLGWSFNLNGKYL